ncbi:MAG: RIP metalloprotease RseP [Bacteroidetes bacterium]|nr:RIP metalloprotease RseP [Bacteroidota bacterium]
MEILIKALQLIMSLSILVILHELGHFIPAKLFKTRVEKFYLFFDPWFSLFKFKRKDTEYGIGWLPLGGYVKISGMIDESMDKEQMKQPPQPWEFRSKPAWQRLIIMLGGVSVNVLLAIFIYIVMLAAWGEDYIPVKNVKNGIACDSAALEAGLKDGDKIISIDNKKIYDFRRVVPEIVLYGHNSLVIERDGKQMNIAISDTLVSKIISTKGFITPRTAFFVDYFIPSSIAEKSGFKKDDKIIGINEKNIEFFDEFRKEIVKHKNLETKIKVVRQKDTLLLDVRVPATGILGIVPKDMLFAHIDYSFFNAIPAGILKGFHNVRDYLAQFKLFFRPKTEAYKSIGGFGAIGNLFPAQWDWMSFWNLTAFLSIILAVMNVLPIPALDGGHVLFLLYEIITRRKPNEKFMEYAQYVGMALLLSLLIFANGNDIVKLFR